LKIKCSGNIFGPKKEEVHREIRILHNKEIRDLHQSSSTVRVKMGWSCSLDEKTRNSQRILMEKPLGEVAT
jgi:hypothetical protein